MRGILVLAAAMVLATEAEAQTPPADVFKELAGSCWRSQMDATQTDTHCFAAAVGGKMVTDTHKVRNTKGEVVYEGISVYLPDKASGELVYEYFYSPGAMMKGYARRAGAEIRFSSKPGAEKPDLVWKLGKDVYDVVPAAPDLGHPGHFVKVKAD